MAGHRSPGGRRVTGDPAPHRVPSRHAATHASPRRGASPRTVASTTAAVGAAFGVLSTGTFAAVTSMGGPSVVPAEASTSSLATTLAANSSTLPAGTTSGGASTAAAHLSPVAFALPGSPSGQANTGAADLELAALDKAGKIADQIAAEHAQLAAAQAAQAKLDALIAQGGLDSWIAQALQVCGLSQSYAPGLKQIIMKESGGNPRAINLWDSNAASGNPSQGLMQVIPSTFRAYVHPSLSGRSITDPVANITAGVRYMVANYGVGTLSAGGRSNSAGSYIGY